MRIRVARPDLADVRGPRKLEIHRDDKCVACSGGLAAGTTAWSDPEARTVTCMPCWDRAGASPKTAQARLQLGDPGAGLMRQHERRRRNRQQRTREAYPRIGVLRALQAAPQHETAFQQGAIAERAVADSLAMRTDSKRVITLHNRRMPAGRGDIDHLAIAPTGVWARLAYIRAVEEALDWSCEDPHAGEPVLETHRPGRSTRLVHPLRHHSEVAMGEAVAANCSPMSTTSTGGRDGLT